MSAERGKTPRPLRALVVGAGLMGRWHADAAARVGAQIAGVCDLDEARALRLASRFGARAGTDLARLLESLEPEVVHLCTPLPTHRQLAEQILAQGIHAIVEKPLAASPEETEALLALARANAARLWPVHQLAYQRWIPRTALVGEILELAYRASSAGAGSTRGAEMDRVATEILPHPLSLFERILPGSLEVARWSATRPAPGELRAHATAHSASFSLSISMQGRPPLHELRVAGTRGTLSADLFHGFAWLEGPSASRIHKIARPFATAIRQLAAAAGNLGLRSLRREPAYPGLRELIRAAYDDIRGGGVSAPSPEHTLRVACSSRRLLAAVDGDRGDGELP